MCLQVHLWREAHDIYIYKGLPTHMKGGRQVDVRGGGPGESRAGGTERERGWEVRSERCDPSAK